MKRGPGWCVAAVCLFGCSFARADAVLPYAFAFQNFGAAPQVSSIALSSPYAGGSYDAASANFNAILADQAGDGASLGYSIVHRVDGTPIPALDFTGTCSIGPGAANAAGTCIGPGAGTTTSASVSIGDGANVSNHIVATVSPHDALVLTMFSLLTGGGSPAQWIGTVFSFFNIADTPSSINVILGDFSDGRHTDISTTVLALVMDQAGDGASLDFTHETLVDLTVVPALTITGACAFGGDPLTIANCPPGVLLAPTTTPFASGVSGTMEIDIDVTLSPLDAAGLTGGLRLFNLATVPEPGSLLLVLLGAAGMAATRRRQRHA